MDNLDKNSLIDKSRFFLSCSDPSSVILFYGTPDDMRWHPRQDFNEIFHNELGQFGIEFGLEPISSLDDYAPHSRVFDVIYSSNEFPVSFLKLANISWRHQRQKHNDYTLERPSFIFGNYYIALTTDDRYKYYIPAYKQGYEKIEDALNDLHHRIGERDMSHIKILYTEYLDMNNLPDIIKCKGKVWSPYHEPGFDMTSTLNKKRFGNLIKTRIEHRHAYIQNILNIISKKGINKMVTCCDMHGTNHIINATEISTISVREVDTPEITAEIILHNRTTIQVDLLEFVKALNFADNVSDQTLVLIESFNDEQEVSIAINSVENSRDYSTMWEEFVKKIQIICDEENKKTPDENLQSSDNIENDDISDDYFKPYEGLWND